MPAHVLQSTSMLTTVCLHECHVLQAEPVALIMAPTRELTSQIYEETRKFSFQTGIRPVVMYGGAPGMNQVRG